MRSLQVEKFIPSQGISFDITVYDGLLKKAPNVMKIHDEYELTVLYNCSGKRIVGNSIQNFYDEDMFLLGPNLPHSLFVDNPETSFAVCIHFTEDSFGRDFFKMPQNTCILKLLSRTTLGCHFYSSEVSHIKKEIKGIMNLDPFHQMMLFLDILYRLSKIKTYENLSSPGYQTLLKRKEAKRMSKIYDYIMDNFQNNLTVEELSNLIYVSPATFGRLFKKTMNKNFTDFLTEVRIGHACKLLLDTELMVSEICYLSGYNHLTHFNNQFKRLMGKTPKKYRESFH